MAKKPDTPCAGCGKLLWSGGTSLPPGQRRCRDCRKAADPTIVGHQKCGRCQHVRPLSSFGPSARGKSGRYCRDCQAAYMRERYQSKGPAICDDCGVPTTRGRTAYGLVCTDCSATRAHARDSRKNFKRRAATRLSDLTAADVRILRQRTKRCPMCQVRLTSQPNRPNSKHLDHIIPVAIGGTHTVGNVRIICRTCNLSRPKDGSDLAGHQPTLWSQDLTLVEAIVIRPRRPECEECGTQLRQGRCWTCRPSQTGRVYGPEIGRLAAKMRADGRKWQDISDELGMTCASTAYQVARRDGDPADVLVWSP